VFKPWHFVSQNVLLKECAMNLSHGSKIVWIGMHGSPLVSFEWFQGSQV
jgi:hypothetical protein